MHPFTDKPAESVTALGELGLIVAIRRWLGDTSPAAPAGIGDDCAVVPASRHRQLVTVDPVIYGEHFNDAVPARAAGEKLLKRNLSDIAAMGGRPRAAVVALALDARVKTKWLEQFYRGIAAVARRYDVPVVGGDIAHHKGGIVATLTLIGEADSGRVLTRSGARVGDWIYVSGTLGGSLRGHHHRFTPRLAEGAWLARRAGVRALLDVSDGLAKDVRALTPPGAVVSLDGAAIPVSVAGRAMARESGRTPLDHALTDGEDYELLFAVGGRVNRAAFEHAWRKTFSTRLTCIGRFTPMLLANALPLDGFRGYEHLR